MPQFSMQQMKKASIESMRLSHTVMAYTTSISPPSIQYDVQFLFTNNYGLAPLPIPRPLLLLLAKLSAARLGVEVVVSGSIIR